jgi:hypothetical protein
LIDRESIRQNRRDKIALVEGVGLQRDVRVQGRDL